MNVSHDKSVKKRYCTPQVVVYGDIREITQTASAKGHNDRHADDPDMSCDPAVDKGADGPKNMCKTG